MITDAILNSVTAAVKWLISILPNMRIDFTPTDQDSFLSVINGVSCIAPVTTAGIILGLIVLVYGLEFLWYLLNYLTEKLPLI